MGIALHADGALTGVFAPKVTSNVNLACLLVDTEPSELERGPHHVGVPHLLLKRRKNQASLQLCEGITTNNNVE